jgi:tRNA A37 threonylcarbamoyladenosine modification protein TsaB
MNIDTLMSDMSIQEETDLGREEIYVSLYQKNSEPIEEDVYMAMEYDEELAEELGLDVSGKEAGEEEDEKEEVVDEALKEAHTRVKTFF